MEKLELYVKKRPKNCYNCPFMNCDNLCVLKGECAENGQPLHCPLRLINDISAQQKLDDAKRLIEFLGKRITTLEKLKGVNKI